MNEPNFSPLPVVVMDISAAANLAVDKLVADTLSLRSSLCLVMDTSAAATLAEFSSWSLCPRLFFPD